MLNKPFTFYFNNDGENIRILGIEPLDNSFTYNINPGKGMMVKNKKHIMINVVPNDENRAKKGEFSFSMNYENDKGREYKLVINVKKMIVRSLKEIEVGDTHLYSEIIK